MSTKHSLLRKYIRESLVTELDFSDVSKAFKSNLGLSKGTSGPQKWFGDFLSRQLDKAGKEIDSYLGQRLDAILPDDLKKKIAQYEKTSGEKPTENLAKVVSAWIKETEEMSGKDFSSAEEKQISDFAAKTYAEVLKKESDTQKALLLVKRKLDMYYGSSLSKASKKTK